MNPFEREVLSYIKRKKNGVMFFQLFRWFGYSDAEGDLMSALRFLMANRLIYFEGEADMANTKYFISSSGSKLVDG